MILMLLCYQIYHKINLMLLNVISAAISCSYSSNDTNLSMLLCSFSPSILVGQLTCMLILFSVIHYNFCISTWDTLPIIAYPHMEYMEACIIGVLVTWVTLVLICGLYKLVTGIVFKCIRSYGITDTTGPYFLLFCTQIKDTQHL